ncbi:MAG: hypothetical protein PHQ66_03720 [Candidatus Nanoarchaeia archaeon]|nr:hypothetical protein [Candidatus Nanoarchaeia archaeon]MDD5357530.1 hypothetical protein [Candidatus Nanoarchaeia archaeon]MDD5588449.1 hypothetical protein [Candidatus Nanoarchaeia archaeon]
MNFIKKVFDRKIDEEVHGQFQKFSRGEFRDRAIIKVKKTGDKYTISTTAEFANEFVRLVAGKLGDEKAKVKGALISTLDLAGGISFQSRKQFMGIKQYGIDREMSGTEILEMLEKFPKVFFALTFDSGKGDILKIKAKAPKSAKPKNKDEAPAPDFCKLITNEKSIAEDFVFEKQNFKLAEIAHDFMIESIVVPDELKNEKDFAVVREKSLRKGRIIRRAVIDGEATRKEVEFAA